MVLYLGEVLVLFCDFFIHIYYLLLLLFITLSFSFHYYC